jgi:hypothetical protein
VRGEGGVGEGVGRYTLMRKGIGCRSLRGFIISLNSGDGSWMVLVCGDRGGRLYNVEVSEAGVWGAVRGVR